jgi:hypothetical protein
MQTNLLNLPLEIRWQILNHLAIENFFILRLISKKFTNSFLNITGDLSILDYLETCNPPQRSLEILSHTHSTLMTAVSTIKNIIAKNINDYAKKQAIVDAAKDPMLAIATVLYRPSCLLFLTEHDLIFSGIEPIINLHCKLKKFTLHQALFVALNHIEEKGHTILTLRYLGTEVTQSELDQALSVYLKRLLTKIINLDPKTGVPLSTCEILPIRNFITFYGANPKQDEFTQIYSAALAKGGKYVRFLKTFKALIDQSAQHEPGLLPLVKRR